MFFFSFFATSRICARPVTFYYNHSAHFEAFVIKMNINKHYKMESTELGVAGMKHVKTVSTKHPSSKAKNKVTKTKLMAW